MKSHPPEQGSSAHSKAARKEPAREPGPKYVLAVDYYGAMKPRRVYPLVVQVPRGKGAVPADTATGVMVTLRPVVPGALVAPAELPLEISRPGARATFHVTPLARGRLPAARVGIFRDGRQVHEVRTPMKVRSQRLAWAILLLALVLPALLLYWTRYAPLHGQVPATRPAVKEEAADESEPKTVAYMRDGSPGEVLQYQLGTGLRSNLPAFPHSREVWDNTAAGAGSAYEFLCSSTESLQWPFWLGVLLLALAVIAWMARRPFRDGVSDSVALASLPSAVTVQGDATAETLPLATPGEGE
jgi:hypothetical protein